MNEPTARQVEVHEAVVRHGGVYDAAGRELGITGQAVGFSERKYLDATGNARIRPLGGVRSPRPPRLSRAEVVAMLPDRITALETLVADQILSNEAMRAQIADLTSAIEGFMARQPIILEVRPRHDRQADGGKGGREETRESQRRLRKVEPA